MEWTFFKKCNEICNSSFRLEKIFPKISTNNETNHQREILFFENFWEWHRYCDSQSVSSVLPSSSCKIITKNLISAIMKFELRTKVAITRVFKIHKHVRHFRILFSIESRDFSARPLLAERKSWINSVINNFIRQCHRTCNKFTVTNSQAIWTGNVNRGN